MIEVSLTVAWQVLAIVVLMGAALCLLCAFFMLCWALVRISLASIDKAVKAIEEEEEERWIK